MLNFFRFGIYALLKFSIDSILLRTIKISVKLGNFISSICFINWGASQLPNLSLIYLLEVHEFSTPWYGGGYRACDHSIDYLYYWNRKPKTTDYWLIIYFVFGAISNYWLKMINKGSIFIVWWIILILFKEKKCF